MAACLFIKGLNELREKLFQCDCHEWKIVVHGRILPTKLKEEEKDLDSMISSHKMIIYEVNLQIKCMIFTEYMSWLRVHIKKLLQIEGFLKAIILEDTEIDPFFKKITVQYHIRHYNHYRDYINYHAADFRQDALERFRGKFDVINRRVFEIVENIELN